MRRRIALAALLLAGTTTLGLSGGAADAVPTAHAPSVAGAVKAEAAAPGKDAFKATRTLSRVFTETDGSQTTVASYDVTVKADHTRNLRGRERVLVSWSGAAPSGGRAGNPYGESGLNQEYPVVVMQCRGTDDPSLPAAEQLRPETCWTSSFSQRSQVLRSSSEATWLHDLYADDADKQRVSGIDPFPTEKCPSADIAPYSTRLTAFDARNGTTYAGCSAETMPPEAAVGSAFPAAEIAAFSDENGAGSVQFEVRSDVENESLGCNDEVACSIVVVPIVGLSCDRPSSPTTLGDRTCRRVGRFAPGSSNFVNDGVDQAVGPTLWWSESNWRNRFSIPITFGLPPDTCDVLDTRAPTGFYGSELLAQAALQWSPAYCLDEQRFKFQLNQMSDEAGFNLMESGEGPAAVVSSLQDQRGSDPIGYAPTAVTGFAVGYVVDRPDNDGEYTRLRINARLLAKLLTQSYAASTLGLQHPGMAGNPISIVNDPEFVALNPGLSRIDQEAAATVLSLSTSSDVIQQVTEYIADDADAMAFVDGEADPWGMRVNPSYQRISLPTSEWPLLDSFIPETQDTCRNENPTVYFNAVAAPVSTMRRVAEALIDAWPNVQTKCEYDASVNQYKIGRIARQSYGSRFLLGIVSLGDAERYGLHTAALQTKPKTFVAPTAASMSSAVSLMEQSRPRGPFTLDQDDVARSGRAYPGTMVVYTAAKLRNLDPTVAGQVAQFVRISTTEGQHVGSGNGQLPLGFLPIKRTGATAKLFASAEEVADAIEAQKPAPVDDSGDDGTDDTTVDPTTPITDPGTDVAPPGDDDLAPPTQDAAKPGPEVTAPPTTDAEVVATSMGTTAETPVGWGALLLPVLVLLGMLGGLVAVVLQVVVPAIRRAM